MKIAYFITPHGFGHASRASAVMEALLRLRPEIQFELFTTCPQQIFKDSIGNGFCYHPVQTDIGMIQLSPLKEDITATCDQLDRFLPYEHKHIDELANHLNRVDCHMVICDIAPLGIAVALAAGLPSVLIENFTWDWFYANYSEKKDRFERHITYLADLVQRADHHIQTPPLCNPLEKAIFMPPISRKTRSSRSKVRKQLGITEQDRMVLITMGGIPDQFEFLSNLPSDLDCHLVVPGAGNISSPHQKVILLPAHSCFFHPDLMAAADALVAKAGYSTVAEAYHSGIPYGYINRPESPESPALESFIRDQMPSLAISNEAYGTGQWLACLPKLLSIPHGSKKTENGADAVAAYIIHCL